MEDTARTERTETVARRIEDALRQAAMELPEKERDNALWLLRQENASLGKTVPILRRAIREVAGKEWLDNGDALQDRELGRQLVEVMNKTLQRYPGTIETQRRIRELLYHWLSKVKRHYPVELDRLDEITLDSEDAKVVQLVKELHGADGRGQKRKDLEEKLDVSEKTLRNYLNRLSGKDEEHPLRLGGQIVSAPVAIRPDETDGKEKYTYTPDTLHPIVLQLNMTQVAYLLKSLCIACNTGFYGHEIAEDLAYGVWSQLTPYAQNRVTEAFAGEHRVTRFTSNAPAGQETAEAQTFAAFLQRMAGRQDRWIDEFVTEREHLDRFGGHVEPMLAFKSECGLRSTWQITSRNAVYRTCRFCSDPQGPVPAIRIVEDALYRRLCGKLFPQERSDRLLDEEERKLVEHIRRKHLGEKVLLDDILKIQPDRW